MHKAIFRLCKFRLRNNSISLALFITFAFEYGKIHHMPFGRPTMYKHINKPV